MTCLLRLSSRGCRESKRLRATVALLFLLAESLTGMIDVDGFTPSSSVMDIVAMLGELARLV